MSQQTLASKIQGANAQELHPDHAKQTLIIDHDDIYKSIPLYKGAALQDMHHQQDTDQTKKVEASPAI